MKHSEYKMKAMRNSEKIEREYVLKNLRENIDKSDNIQEIDPVIVNIASDDGSENEDCVMYILQQ